MRALKFLFLSLLAVILSACVAEPEGENVKIGGVAPDFSVEVFSGGVFSSSRTISLSSMKGKPVVLVFFNTSCPDCREELAEVQKLYDLRGDDAGFLCVARSENLESVEAYWTDNELTLPVAPQNDSRIYNLYARSIIPRTYILDSKGIIVATFSDSPVADFSSLNRIIDTVLQ